MPHHVLIGGGPAATAALETLRQLDGGQSQVTLISDEPPHSRMALPYWLAGKVPRDHVLTADEQSLQRLGAAHIRGRVARIDPQGKQLTLADGQTVAFDDLLIATGAAPVPVEIPGVELPGVQPLWTIDHTQRLLDTAANHPRPKVVFIGAGFIGFIVLNAMFKRHWELAVVEREPQVLPRMLDAGAAELVQDWFDRQGVQVHVGCTVKAIVDAGEGRKRVELSNGQSLPADLVITAVGIRPNTDLAHQAGIACDQGILIDDHCRTNFPFIYAAGDCAQGPVLFSDQREIHAIQPTAVDHGRVVGANMAGRDVAYPGSLAMNVVDVCGLQCASFGNWQHDADATTIRNASRHLYRKLVWSDDRLVGAIFTGQPNDLGMLNDVGMVKGILQTQTALGPWKDYLVKNPFDIRRAYVALQVGDKLIGTRLVGAATRNRAYRFGDAPIGSPPSEARRLFVETHPGG